MNERHFMVTANQLVEKIKAYDSQVDAEQISRAYEFCKEHHSSQMRASGEPYYTHPVAVAELLTGLKLDQATIITALLHDTVEDTEATLEDIEKLFGKEVCQLVDGVTKLNQLQLKSNHSSQAENFRKLVLAMSEDIRVLLVKLADRVHNMQTLHFLKKEEKRLRIARETIEIYAPLAERISIAEFKEALEDYSFKELNYDARESIVKRLNFLRKEDQDIVQGTIKELKKLLKQNNIVAEVLGREKSPYSIWRKMQRQNISFETLTDIVAFRILVDTIPDCYQALGILHSVYRVVPSRFKDYISMQKPNGYQSIHTSVIGPNNQKVEIQIRTKEMDEAAVYGVAAHWQYKQGVKTDGTSYRWLRELLDILDQAGDTDEFLEHTKLEMFQDQVFCFSPKGEVYSLPVGSTPVDFAYAVHSEVGDHCVGAKINGRMVPLRSSLKNGDQIDIMTSKAQTPSPEWERFVITGKAKARIRRFIRLQQREQFVTLGKEILLKIYRQESQEFTEKGLENILKSFKCDTVEDLYVAVGSGHFTAREIFKAVFPGLKKVERKEKLEQADLQKKKTPKKKANAIPIKGLIQGMAVKLAKCCHPLPGDRIVGIVTTGKGVTIHTIDCDTLENFSDVPERWLDLSWEKDEDDSPTAYMGRLKLQLINDKGVLSVISTIIAKNHGNIMNLKITHRSQDFYEMYIDVEVLNLKHLVDIIAALRTSTHVSSVERTKR